MASANSFSNIEKLTENNYDYYYGKCRWKVYLCTTIYGNMLMAQKLSRQKMHMTE